MYPTPHLACRTALLVLAGALLALALGLGPAEPVQAATCTVTSALDDGSIAGTLRMLLADAGCDTVNFDSDYTIYLASTLTLDRSVTIDGAGHTVVISGDSNNDGTADVQPFHVDAGVTAAIQNLTVTKGQSAGNGGGIYNAGTLTVTGVTLLANRAADYCYGGAIFNDVGASLTVMNSSILNNNAYYGVGIYNDDNATLAVTNSTFSGNTGRRGGGISNEPGATLTLTNSTLSGNSVDTAGWGGAIHNRGAFTSRNSILTNSGNGNCWNDGGTITGSNNLANDTSCGESFTNSSTIRLGALGSYGGSTQTFPLLPASAALEAGDDASCPATDQRGITRSQGSHCDIGAFESQGFTVAVSSGDNQSAATGAAFASPLAVTVSSAFGEPVQGGEVTFASPTSGAGTTQTTAVASIGADGAASMNATADYVAGAYDVTASTVGGTTATFHLTNSEPSYTLTVSGGDNQSTGIGQPFAIPLSVILKDGSGVPAPGVVVTFNAPTSDASTDPAVFTVTTNADGVASYSATANVVQGSYDVVASVGGLSATVHLTNDGCPANTLTVTNNLDSGEGSLRNAIAWVCPGGTVNFDNDYTIYLGSALTVGHNMTVDGAGHTIIISGDTGGDGSANVQVFYINAGVTAAVQNLTVTKGKSAGHGGGVYNAGTLTVTNVTVSDGGVGDYCWGGGIYNATGATATVMNSALLNNNAFYGGGISNDGATLAVTNSTFSGNWARVGGGISNNYDGQLTLTNSTFSGNTNDDYNDNGGAIHNRGVLTARNSILTNSGEYSHNCWNDGGTISGSNNLANDGSCGASFANSGTIRLGALGSYGGSTQTFPLLPGSAALNAGDDAACPAADQRGIARPQGSHCDIGAFESQGFTVAVSGGDNQSTAVGTAFASPLAVTVSSAFSEPVQGGAVTFTSPTSGASTSQATYTAAIGTGGAASVNVTANYVTGAYDVTASAGAGTNATFHLTNSGTSHTLAISGGNGQSTAVTAPFATPLSVTLTDASGAPVQGAVVTFNAPASGASTNPATFTATTDAGGVASTTPRATGEAGGPYDVVASTGGLSVTFHLTNVGVTLALTGGNDQSTGTTLSFVNPLQVTVTRVDDQPGQGAVVTFAAPTSGASTSPATFTATADANGLASAGATANSTEGGPYDVVASIGEQSVTFHLTNAACPANTLTVTNANDSGAGSLRDAIAWACPGGTVNFDADYTIYLASTLTLSRNVTIDGAGHTVVISGDSDAGGSGNLRPFYVNSGVTAALSNLTVTKGTASYPGGGAIYVDGTLALANCTISDSYAYNGAGVYNDGTVTATNCTFAGNRASSGGGGVYNDIGDRLEVTNCTFAGNRAYDGGGVYNYYSARTTSYNSVFVRGSQGGNCYNKSGASVVGSTNRADDGTCGSSFTNSSTIRLGSLGAYGGHQATVPLTPGSSALDAGSATYCPELDQRGMARVGTCDIGAFEAQGFTFAYTGGDYQTTPVSMAFANPLQLTLSETGGVGLGGAAITFTGPSSGASTDPATFTATTDASGTTQGTAKANSVAGGWYDVLASTADGQSVTFHLTNTGITLSLTGGDNQTTPVAHPFANPLEVTVIGASGAAVEGAVVSFTAPASGPSLSQATFTATTDASGVASAGVIANYEAGEPYEVVASFAGLSVTFHLTNAACPAADVVVTNGDDAGEGSLRAAIADVCPYGRVTFAGDTTVPLASELILTRHMAIDGGDYDVTISGDTNDDGTPDTRVFKVQAGVTATLQNLTVTKGGCEACNGGGLYNQGAVTIVNSVFTGNSAINTDGGAIYNDRGTIEVHGSTFSANSAGNRGGAIYDNEGTLRAYDSTFSDNIAVGSSAGGIYQYNTALEVRGGTFSGNSPQAIYQSWRGTLWIHNSLFVKGTGSNCGCAYGTCYDWYGANNLMDDTSCVASAGFVSSPSILLGHLGSYGGNTPTIPLLPGSAAIDAGDPTICSATDQRGVARPQGAGCDIGAFESRGFTFTRTGGNLQSTPIFTTFSQPLQVALAEAGGSPLPGATVTFTGPEAGAGAAPAVATATTDATGLAQVTATANGAPGMYIVSAGTGGLNLEFSLTNLKAGTTTSLESAPNPSDPGETVTFTAIVTSASPGVTPGGTVAFYEQQGTDDMVLVSEAPSSEVRLLAEPEDGELPPGSVVYTFSTSSLASGVHAIVAVYSGDDLTDGSTSNTVEQTVRSGPVKVDSATTLTSAPNPSNYHQKVTFTAAVSGSAGTPTGTVTFYENPAGDEMQGIEATSSNVVPLVNGVAVFKTSSLSIGIHNLVAIYSGDEAYNGSTSNTVDQAVAGKPAVVTQPVDQTVVAGQLASFNAEAVGYPTPTVRWQVSTDGGGSWSDIADATATTLTFTADVSQNGYLFRAVFTSAAGSATSQAAALTVHWPPAITQDPANQTVVEGQTATFSAAAGANPAPTVQWQVSTDGGATWADLDGATSASLSFSTVLAQNGYQYHAVFSNSAGSATSAAATLTVHAVLAVTVHPQNAQVTAGQGATFNAAAGGDPAPAVQWQVSTDGGGSWVSLDGATSTPLTFIADGSHNGRQYRAVFTNDQGSVTTDAATLTVLFAPIITQEPADQAVIGGQTATFSAAANGNPAPTVRWQVSTDGGGTWADLDGANATTYSFTADASQDGYRYHAVFANEYGSATTTTATLTVSTVQYIRVASLAGSSVWMRQNAIWQAIVVVTLDPAGEGAVVTGAWSTGASGTCTIAGGSCQVILQNISKKVASVTFTVSNVALAGYIYDPSGPTSVTMNKP